MYVPLPTPAPMPELAPLKADSATLGLSAPPRPVRAHLAVRRSTLDVLSGHAASVTGTLRASAPAEVLTGRAIALQVAVGRRLLLLRTAGPPTWAEVVGVVEHVQMDQPRSKAQPELFVTYAIRQYSDLNIVYRAANATALVPAVRDAVQRLGPGRLPGLVCPDPEIDDELVRPAAGRAW